MVFSGPVASDESTAGWPWLQKVNGWSAGDLARVGFGHCLKSLPRESSLANCTTTDALATPPPMNGPISIRVAVKSEQSELEALQRRASLANEYDRDSLLANPDAIHLPREHIETGRVFVAERYGAVAGFAVVLTRPDGNAELDGLFVEPGKWRGGIGRTLVDHAAAFARSEGAATLHVIGNPHAALFYQAGGFAVLGKNETRFGSALAMSRNLATGDPTNTDGIGP